MESPPIVPTVGEIARRIGVPLHRVEYVIRARNIEPTGRAGNALIYSDADVERIASELRRIEREERVAMVDTPTVPQPRLGDVTDVAAITKTSSKTVRRLIDAGKMPGVCRIRAKLIRVDLDMLDRWIAQGCPPLHRFNAKGAQAS